jgi:hypothetical protein
MVSAKTLPRVGNHHIAQKKARTTAKVHAVFHQHRVGIQMRAHRREFELRRLDALAIAVRAQSQSRDANLPKIPTPRRRFVSALLQVTQLR